jgi:hypothetical protein
VLAVVVAIIISRPVGLYLQTFTTDGQPGELVIREVRERHPSPLTHAFRILLGRNKQTPMRSFYIRTEG